MAEEVGLGDQLRFTPVGAGFFVDGEMHDFNGLGDFAALLAADRRRRALRLAWFVAQCQLRSSYAALENIPLESWLRRHCGNQVVRADLAPAARLALRRRPRRAAGHLPLGAHQAHALGAHRAGRGGEDDGLHRRRPPAPDRGDRSRARASSGVEVRTGRRRRGPRADRGRRGHRRRWSTARRSSFDLTIPTLQPPALRFLLPDAPPGPAARRLSRSAGSACVCLILKVRALAAALLRGQHLRADADDHARSRPRRCWAPSTPTACTSSTCPSTAMPRGDLSRAEDDESIYERFTDDAAQDGRPASADDDVVDWTVQRAQLVEPVHAARATSPRIAPVWPGVEGLGAGLRRARSTRAC